MAGNEDVTQLEALMAQTANGRMKNVMHGSIQRFRSSSVRRKKDQASTRLNTESDEENDPVSVERSPQDGEPSPRSRVMDRSGSEEHNKPLWESFPDRVSVSEGSDSKEPPKYGYTTYVPGDVENEARKPKVLDYFSKTSPYCYNDRKFRPIKSADEQDSHAHRSPKSSVGADIDELVAENDELDDAKVYEPDAPLLEDVSPGDKKPRPKAKAKVVPTLSTETSVKVTAWEDEDDASSVASVLGGFVSTAAATLGLGEDKSVKERVALDVLLEAKAKRPGAQLADADRGVGI